MVVDCCRGKFGFVRVYAAYGGVYIAVSVLWL